MGSGIWSDSFLGFVAMQLLVGCGVFGLRFKVGGFGVWWVWIRGFGLDLVAGGLVCGRFAVVWGLGCWWFGLWQDFRFEVFGLPCVLVVVVVVPLVLWVYCIWFLVV